ncbi:hypothetical protein FD722_07920 [Photobacterium damselae subsp. damselae]|uniref:hypothetical protein n=1 Tax=Photobacterium damselae TaxID=38293 RepID=UPI0010FE693B|nr:hypothetical protein [Photobacterium damselae]MBA5683813.1 hypothetical protein [Photobacterium damselae subsp. damselae]NVH50166.1 hypothetical protein [Photobacterium damselae subsp. damselae]NVO80586.1 hypothetical protein [Photobacterium damselae subsp. damselae]TLS80041.1 hypothetical protein FD719_19605 [Photobacterium damselae subsp. damselae]TLS90635.1 hypothetical protein FD722_07920 [Photobacterium damselae subsp. damselae]
MYNENLFLNLLQYSTLSLMQGRTKKSIEIELMEDGLSQDIVTEIVNRASEYKKKTVRKNGLKQIGIGSGFIILGGMITIATYSVASISGHYVVTTGLFLVGVWNIVKGLWKCLVG